MKKARQFFGLLLATILIFSLIPTNLARADDFTNDDVITMTTENTEDKTEKIISEYLQGIYESEEALNFRKEIVEKYNLQDKVDGDFFFKDEYLNDLIDDETIGEKIVLVKLSKKGSSLDDVIEMSNTERSAIIQSIISEVEGLSRGISNVAESNTFEIESRSNSIISISPKSSNGEVISYAPSTGATIKNEGNIIYSEGGIMMGQTDKFTINGVIAFCADHSERSPGTGTKVVAVEEYKDSLIRKILYYGFNGPKQVSGWDTDGLRVATSMAMSEVRNGDGRNLGKRLLNQVSSLAEPPSEFVAYLVTLENDKVYQKLATWELKQVPKKGKLRIKKETSNLDVSKKNNYYTTNGAVYGVYSDAACKNKVAELTTVTSGWSDYIELDGATYYLKEISAPEGFQLSTEVYNVQVTAGSSTDKTVYDTPIHDPVGVLIKKVDSRTGTSNSNLGGAEFTVKFYAGQYEDGIDPASQGVAPTRTWILRTNENGFVYLADNFKIGGDAFYINTDTNNPTIPLGTITIQETKAPDGYRINSQLIVKNIKPEKNQGILEQVYQAPTIQEDSVDFQLKKVQTGTDIVLQGVKFKYTDQDGKTSTLTTDQDGLINIRQLKKGIPNKAMSFKESGDNGVLTVGNSPNNYSFKIIKTNDKGVHLKDAEFTIYSDKELKNVVETKVTDENGIVIFNNLTPGIKYYAKETKAPEGYTAISDVKEIYATSTPVQDKFSIFVDGTEYTSSTQDGSIIIEGDKSNIVAGMTVVNDVMMKLPETGSNMMIPLLLIGSFLMLSYLYLDRKSNKKLDSKGE